MGNHSVHNPLNFLSLTLLAFIATKYLSAPARSSPPTPSSSASTFNTSSGRFGHAPTRGSVAVERGWCLGDKDFKKELLAQMHERRGDHYGPELREADLEHAERVLKEELSQRGWRETELSRRRKGDPEKIEIASQLRARSTMTLKWIAERLKMGTWTYASTCLVLKRKKDGKCK